MFSFPVLVILSTTLYEYEAWWILSVKQSKLTGFFRKLLNRMNFKEFYSLTFAWKKSASDQREEKLLDLLIICGQLWGFWNVPNSSLYWLTGLWFHGLFCMQCSKLHFSVSVIYFQHTMLSELYYEWMYNGPMYCFSQPTCMRLGKNEYSSCYMFFFFFFLVC